MSNAFRGEHHKSQATDYSETLSDDLNNKLQSITACSLGQRERINDFTDS